LKWFAWEATAVLRKAIFALAISFVSSNGHIQLLVLATYSCVRTFAPQLSSLNIYPSIPKPQPSSLNPKPSTCIPQPQTLNL
jgi:hypothetical protein